MELIDDSWKKLEGAYRTLYDASHALRQLELATKPKEIQNIFDKLWSELHHQGDVGIASYVAMPQLVRICKAKKLFDFNLLSFCCVIEQQRHLGNNPTLPIEYQEYYYQGLSDLKSLVLTYIDKELEDSIYTLALAALATCSGRIKLGKAIMELEDNDIIDEFLEQF